MNPIVTPELLKKLDQVFPACPDRSMGSREIDFRIGQREVVDYLHALLKEVEHATPELS